MAETAAIRKPVRRWLINRTFLAFLGTVLVLAIGSFIGGLIWLDSDQGHSFIADQIEARQPEDGLRISIGSIEGSIYGKVQVVDLELRDPVGPFFRAGQVAVDWSPMAWIFNELSLNNAVIAKAKLERLPQLIDTGEDSPLLPSFDIYVQSFRADNLALGEAIAGEEQYADLSGAIDVRSGRAMLNIDAATTRSGDKLELMLNAEPANQKLDLNANIVAPKNGALASIFGFDRDMAMTLEGEGDWQKWDGALNLASAEQSLSALDLTAREGLFGFDGDVSANLFPKGIAQKITAPRVNANGTVSIEDGLAKIDMAAQSTALAVGANGGFDFESNGLDAMRIAIDVRNPSAVSSSLKAQDLQLKALLNGRISELRYQYLLTAPQLAFGKSLVSNVRVEGEGQRDATGWDIPVDIAAGTLVGNGELLQQLVSGLDGKAFLRLERGRLFADQAVVRTNMASGTVDIDAELASGDFAINLNAQAPGFPVNGIGIADLVAKLKLGPGAVGIDLNGTVTADLRRFDNTFLRELGGGLPKLASGLSLGPDGRLRFNDLSIAAPKMTVSGSGAQKEAGTFAFTGSGTHDQYGTFDIDLNGRLDRPEIALLLYDPLPAAELADVRIALLPNELGFSYTAAGGSTLGPFDSDGVIVARAGAEAIVRVDRLLVTDTLAQGTIRPTSGGLTGDLKISGGGVNGKVSFKPSSQGGVNTQLISAKIIAQNARFEGNPPITIRAGTLDADLVLIEGKSDVSATVRAQGISRGGVMIGRVAGNANLSNGTGSATFSMAGTRGSTFNFQARADISPDRYRVTGNGAFEGRALRLNQPLVMRRANDGWIASQTTLSFGNGRARVSGKWGSGSSNLDLRLTKMPLSILDIAYDDLELGGEANGTVKLAQTGSQMPKGEAKLTISGLTRSGLILTSTPVDLGLNVAISSRNAAARGVVKSLTGKTIGRFQGRVSGLGTGRWQDELLRKPLFAQARFNGAADSLWRLTGVETFDLTGPVAVSADVAGTLANPQIEGQVRTSKARLESPLTGTVITDIQTRGEFDGSKLILSSIAGKTKGGGLVSGSGNFNFAVAPDEGIGIQLDVQAKNATLIARDDFAATVTGPISIRSSPEGGSISGDVILNRSFFKFGRASETVALPDINVTEINRRADERPRRVRSRPWQFAINADAPNRLQVEGLGLDSEWRAKLKVAGPVDNFSLRGSANLVRGNYTFAGRRFRLERGRIRFVGNRPPDPVLDIEAEANLTGLNATINVTGTGNRPEIAFNSLPALPQDELLSRILFGASIADLSAPEAVQLAAAVASLNSGGGLDPINQLRKAVGLDRLRILPSDIDSGAGTSIAAGKYITRRAYVELITDGKGYSATRLEFQITRWLSILSSISTLGRQSANIQVSRDY